MMPVVRSTLALALVLSSGCGRPPPRAAPGRAVAMRAQAASDASTEIRAANQASPSRAGERPPPYPEWISPEAPRIIVETSAGMGAGRFVDDGTTLVGAHLRLGARWARVTSVGTDLRGRIRGAVAGNLWGFDVRIQPLWEPGAKSPAPDWMIFGIGIVADHALGDEFNHNRVRIPSLMGLALPEVGILVAPGAPKSFYMAHALPVYLLLNENIALEARPCFTLRFKGGDAHETDALLSFSLGLMAR
jgi:hypothetical protein